LKDCFLGVWEKREGLETVLVEVTADISPSSRVCDPRLARSQHGCGIRHEEDPMVAGNLSGKGNVSFDVAEVRYVTPPATTP
jgi:hypothetical protein